MQSRDITRLVPQASGRKKSAIVAQQTQDARIKALEREIYELKRSNEILRKAAAFFAQAELDRKPK